MLQPGKPGLEVFVAEGALEGPVLGVEDHVLLQVRPPGEGLQADLIQDDQIRVMQSRSYKEIWNSVGWNCVLRYISSHRSSSSVWSETPERVPDETWR